MLRNRETQPRAAFFTRTMLLYPVKPVKDTRLIRFGNADAAVSDNDPPQLRIRVETNVDFAFIRRVFDRIIQ
ncbi:hypothetical protein D3C85_1709500 [compost metagenome]